MRLPNFSPRPPPDMADNTNPPRFWLSVLVPVFRVEAYLEQCLASIMAEADAGVEVLICDDASPDASAVIAQAFAKAWPGQVRLIRHAANRGIAATRNSLLDSARGDYLWFIDSDDWLHPGAIAAVARVVRAHRPDMIGCDYTKQRIRRWGFGGPSGRLLTDRDQITGGICASRKMYIWLRIVRRDCWPEALRFPEGRVFEDAAVIPRLALEMRSYFHISRALVAYRVRSGSILASIKNARQSFDMKAHGDLAHALQGFPALLDAQVEPFALARFGASHFVAMEFAKTAERIRRSGVGGQGLIGQFRAQMELASPVPFDALLARYRGRGRMLAWWRLRRALGWAAKCPSPAEARS